MTETGAAAGASFYALGPEFEWLASAWDGFARDLAETSGTLRHITSVAAASPALAAESSGLAALESATDRLVRELVDDAARIRRTLATYEHADAAVRASVPPPPLPSKVPGPPHTAAAPPGPVPAPAVPSPGPESCPEPGPAHPVPDAAPSAPGAVSTVPPQALWHPDPPAAPSSPAPTPAPTPVPVPTPSETTALGTLSRIRRDMLARAERWVEEKVPYSQEHWHEGYRTDCSGYVSMCWGLRDSMVTSTMPQIAHPIAKENLRAGDVLLNTDVATGHVILFDRWADYAHASYVGFELCPGGTLHHVIPYPYYDGYGTYEPYRYNNAGS